MAENETKAASAAADEILEAMKGSLQNCFVVGFDNDGRFVMNSSVQNVPWMHWMLNKSVFEIGIFERGNSNNSAAPETETPDEEDGSDADKGNSN